MNVFRSLATTAIGACALFATGCFDFDVLRVARDGGSLTDMDRGDASTSTSCAGNSAPDVTNLYVNPGATAQGATGSQLLPYTTLGAALTAATQGGEVDIWLASGAYPGATKWAAKDASKDSLHLLGGYDPKTWCRATSGDARSVVSATSSIDPVMTVRGALAMTSVDLSSTGSTAGLRVMVAATETGTALALSDVRIVMSNNGGLRGIDIESDDHSMHRPANLDVKLMDTSVGLTEDQGAVVGLTYGCDLRLELARVTISVRASGGGADVYGIRAAECPETDTTNGVSTMAETQVVATGHGVSVAISSYPFRSDPATTPPPGYPIGGVATGLVTRNLVALATGAGDYGRAVEWNTGNAVATIVHSTLSYVPVAGETSHAKRFALALSGSKAVFAGDLFIAPNAVWVGDLENATMTPPSVATCLLQASDVMNAYLVGAAQSPVPNIPGPKKPLLLTSTGRLQVGQDAVVAMPKNACASDPLGTGVVVIDTDQQGRPQGMACDIGADEQ
ncbi:MAG: hypothetical protein ABI321_20760 [Polyangia bacterium]